MRLYYPTLATCFIGFCITFVVACAPEATPATKASSCYQLPVGTHLPRLSALDTQLNLSFVRTLHNYAGPTPKNRLNTAYWSNEEGWTEEWKITEGDNFFVNWADFPSVRFYRDEQGTLQGFAHWLEYSGAGTYDYDIKYATDDIDEAQLHQDTVSAEHGFLSSAALPAGGLQVTWLDGRYTKLGADAGAAEGTEGHGHGGGAMTLRTKALNDSTSIELDHRVCDCCNTATVATDSLIMVAYRDRSEHEIRDIGYVFKRTGSAAWSTPKLVHADNWEIAGCPVNGPALAANERGDIAIVWYTAPAGRAQILFSRYDTATDAWQPPTLLADNNPIGRVDLQLADDGTAYATALTSMADESTAALTLWKLPPGGDVQREQLATTSPGRSSGFPKIALFQDTLFWARTVVGAEKTDHYVEVCHKGR